MKRRAHSTARLLGIASVVVLLAQMACAEDFTVRMGDEHGNSTSTHYVNRNAVRNVASSPVASDIIYRIDTGTIITLDHDQKTYGEIQAAEIRRRIEKERSEITPQQQERMRSLGYGGAASVTKIGAGENIAGYATEKYSFKTPMNEGEIWLAPALEVPPGYYDMLVPLVPGISGMGMVFKELKDKQMKGFVLKSVETIRITPWLKSESPTQIARVAISVEEGQIPASTFEPPAGYRKLTQRK